MARSTAAQFLPFLAAGLVFTMVVYPEISFHSALRGLLLWWEVVFPALLPFFVGGQMLMGLGFVHFLGVLLEPTMRPLFNLPGVGGFVTSMGLASGYPIGAVLTARLRKDNEITVAEGERLMSFANTADPLFMAGAVAVGMFGDGTVAGVLILSHYIGAVATGFLLRFYRRDEPARPRPEAKGEGIFRRAFRELVEARARDGRPLGHLFGDCIRNSMDTLMLVGGFIILFSVILQILNEIGLVSLMAAAFGFLLKAFGFSPDLGPGLVAGTFEITLGNQWTGGSAAPLSERLIIASAITAWAGLSVHAQVAAIIQGTGMRMTPYLLARLAHAVFAASAAAVLLHWEPLVAWLGVHGPAIAVGAGFASPLEVESSWFRASQSLRLFGTAVGVMTALALWSGILAKLRSRRSPSLFFFLPLRGR